MSYLTGDIPVGAYDSKRLTNVGLGHGTVDGGDGYTFFDPQTGTNCPLLSAHLQFHKPSDQLPERDRFPPGLGRFAISI
jgi:hypothetical protein